jgi:hypothetical protein
MESNIEGVSPKPPRFLLNPEIGTSSGWPGGPKMIKFNIV